jgi:hypothetical protein
MKRVYYSAHACWPHICICKVVRGCRHVLVYVYYIIHSSFNAIPIYLRVGVFKFQMSFPRVQHQMWPYTHTHSKYLLTLSLVLQGEMTFVSHTKLSRASSFDQNISYTARICALIFINLAISITLLDTTIPYLIMHIHINYMI